MTTKMVYDVHNAGLSGNNSRDLLAKMDQEVLARHPKLVVLMVGSNDMLNSGNSTPLEEYRRNLEAIAEKCKRANASLLLMTIPPCHPPYLIARHKKEYFAERAPELRVNDALGVIRLVASRHALPVVEVNRIFERVGNVGTEKESVLRNEINCGDPDGVHPTPEGYRLIAVAVFQAIVDHQLPRDQIVCYGDSITHGVHVEGAGTVHGQTYPALLAAMLKDEMRV